MPDEMNNETHPELPGIPPADAAAKVKKNIATRYLVGRWGNTDFEADETPFFVEASYRTLPDLTKALKNLPDDPNRRVLHATEYGVARRVKKTTRVFESMEIKLT